jgi:hypothetical protein
MWCNDGYSHHRCQQWGGLSRRALLYKGKSNGTGPDDQYGLSHNQATFFVSGRLADPGDIQHRFGDAVDPQVRFDQGVL